MNKLRFKTELSTLAIHLTNLLHLINYRLETYIENKEHQLQRARMEQRTNHKEENYHD